MASQTGQDNGKSESNPIFAYEFFNKKDRGDVTLTKAVFFGAIMGPSLGLLPAYCWTYNCTCKLNADLYDKGFEPE